MVTDNKEKQEQRFDVSSGSELSVSNVSGRIGVRAQEGSEIVVSYSKRGSSRSLDNTHVEIRRDGNRVSVQTRSATVGLINFGRSSWVEYDIVVPKDCAVRLHTVSSDIDLRGSRASVGVQTVSGDASIHDIAGDITITTVSGDLDASNLAGTLVARTTSGDAKVMSSRLRRFNLNTVSGDFVLETPIMTDEQSNAKTVSGDLELLLPAGSGATIQLKSLSGSVSCEPPADIIKSGRRHWQGRVNGGGGHVEMNSVSGDLRIGHSRAAEGQAFQDSPADGHGDRDTAAWGQSEQQVPLEETDSGMELRDDSATTTDLEPNPAGDVDGAADILRSLERGEITVDEAMAKLG